MRELNSPCDCTWYDVKNYIAVALFNRPCSLPNLEKNKNFDSIFTYTNNMAARDSVLNTVELLENILLQLPPERIARVQLVSKQWQEVISSSPQLYEHVHIRVISPIRFEGPGKPGKQIPVYEKPSELEHELNPAICDHVSICVDTESRIAEFSINISEIDADSEQIVEAMNLPLTFPIIQSVQICAINSYGRDSRDILSNEHGIVVGHLIAVKKEIDRTIMAASGYLSIPARLRWELTALFKEDMTERHCKAMIEAAEEISESIEGSDVEAGGLERDG